MNVGIFLTRTISGAVMIRGPFCVFKSHFITQMYAMCSTSLPLHELLSLPRRLARSGGDGHFYRLPYDLVFMI